MFYLKHKGRRLEIHDDNVYTRCPQCGKERVVDLQEILSSGDGDLYGTAIFCSSCLEKHKKEIKLQELGLHASEIESIARRHNTSSDEVKGIVTSGLEHGFDVKTCLIGARLALSLSDGVEEYFTAEEAAAVMGTDEQTAVQALEKAGVSPARITTLPGFEWLLGK